MIDLGVEVGPGCVLQIADTRVEVEEVGWVEETTLEVLARPTCPWVSVRLPRDVVLGETRVRQRLGDGSGTRLGDERWELSPRSIDGSGTAILHTPELVGGDRVIATFERHLPPGPFRWRPGPAKYAEAELVGDGALTAPNAVENAVGPRPPRNRVTRGDPPADWFVQFARVAPFAATAGEMPRGRREANFRGPGLAPAGDQKGAEPPRPVEIAGEPVGEEPPLAPHPLPAGDVRVEEELELVVPPGDPLMRLYPGGGSSVQVHQRLVFPPATEDRVWPLDVAPGTAVEVRSEPAGATLDQDRGGSRIVVPSSEGTTRVTARFTTRDAPFQGEKGDLGALTVAIADGEIVWDGDVWYLARVRDRVVVPSREALIRGLGARFRAAALREPGAPIELRGLGVTWDTAAELRPALSARIAIGDWPADPLFPRRLIPARKSGALTPVEAGLVLWLYAVQLHFDADWVLVRPAPRGPGSVVVPVGADTALVRITIGDEVRWIDPGCGVCAPFEIRPSLEGATAHGPVERTPDPSPGRLEVTWDPEQIVWKASGSAAVDLRLALHEVAADERTAALAHRIGGPSATLGWTEGLDQAGGEVLVQVTRGTGIAEDPLGLPVPNGAGTVWVDWVGARVLKSPVPADLVEETRIDEGPLHYHRYRDADHLVEELTIDQRELDGAAVARMDAARRPVAVSPPGPDPGSP